MSDLEGKEIAQVRGMTDEELEDEYWQHAPDHHRPVVLVLEDGTKLYPSTDPEGNGPGQFFGEKPDGEGFALFPKQD
jgi:hypothetical protein